MVESYSNRSKRIAEYFTVCGLPDNPRPYDYSQVLEHAEEIILPGTSVEFTTFREPIVGILLTNVKEESQLPVGFHGIYRSYSGKCKASIKVPMGDEVYICYSRSRNKPPVTNISMFTENDKHLLKPGASKLTETLEGHSANFGFVRPTYLTYTLAEASSGIDQLAVVDMCIIFPDKGETCPPAFNQISEPLSGSLFGGHAYLCFRKSLVKEYTIAYEPEVLFSYRVPSVPLEFNCYDTDETGITAKQNNNDQDNLDPEIRQVAHFCLPWGASIESWSVDQQFPQPNHFTFVLTNESWERLYGVAFTFHEPFDVSRLDKDKCYRLGIDPELAFNQSQPGESGEDNISVVLDPVEEAKITARQKHFVRSRVGDRVIGVTKALCILSRWSFPVAFTNFLAFLYSRCYPGACMDHIPLERYLAYFFCEVPFPDQIYPNVLVQLCAAPILLELPYEPDTSTSCGPFFYLLNQLGVDLTINLFVHMLTEQKVLLTSVQPLLLGRIGEALISMIFPLQWTVVYIPFIYMGHVQIIQSPSPYLIGIDSHFFDFFQLPSGNQNVTYVDLDTRNFRPANVPGGAPLDARLLPKKPREQLRKTLTSIYKRINAFHLKRSKDSGSSLLKTLFTDANSDLAETELTALRFRQRWFVDLNEMTEIGTRIKRAFLQFMAYLLREYRRYLIPIREIKNYQMFDVKAFLDQVAEDRTRSLYKLLFETQQWANFVCDRTFTSAREDQLASFDGLVVHLFGSELDDKQTSSRVSSNSSLSHNTSLSDDSVINVPSSADEAVDFPLNCPVNNSPPRIVGPPTWPLPDLVCDHLDSVDSPEPFSSQRVKDRPFDLVPVCWNTNLLDRLVMHAYRLQTYPELGDPCAGSTDAIPNRREFWASRFELSASTNSLQSNRLFSKGIPFHPFPDYLFLPTVDTPSPVPNRSKSSVQLGLTGLPTNFPLSVPGSLILRRSPLELRHPAPCPKSVRQANYIDWSKYLVSSIYSLWYMLLPGYLCALYSCASHGNQRNTAGESYLPSTKVNACLTEAVHMATRLSRHQMECSDQVIWRILLVLVYQIRPPRISPNEVLNWIQWNGTSVCLANQIFKALEKENEEVLYQASRRARQHAVAHLESFAHRRSASDCCHTNIPLDTTANELVSGMFQQDPDSKQISEPLPHAYHRQSSASVADKPTSDDDPPCLSCIVTKSETDSGVLFVTSGADEGSHGEQTSATILSSQITSSGLFEEAVGRSFDVGQLGACLAPLATMDDITDLGYSTLHRPLSPGGQLNHQVSDSSRSSECGQPTDSINPRVFNSPPQRQPEIYPTSDASLEYVQKPPQMTWFESRIHLNSRSRAGNRPELHSILNGKPGAAGNPAVDTDTDSDRSDESGSTSDSSSRQPVRHARPISTHSRSVGDERAALSPPLTSLSCLAGESNELIGDAASCVDSEESGTLEKTARGSLDYWNDKLTAWGNSEVPSKMLRFFKTLFTPGHGASAASTPNQVRRASITERLLMSTPNSDRLPRNMRQWSVESTDLPFPVDRSISGLADEHNQTTDSGSQPESIQAATASSPSPPLQHLNDLWLRIGGKLIVGAPAHRLLPVTIPTHLSMDFVRPPFTCFSNPCLTSSSSSLRHPVGHDKEAAPVKLVDLASSSTCNPSNPDVHIQTDNPKPPYVNGVTYPEAVQLLNVVLTTCNRCPSCEVLVYDEEILAAWSNDAEDYSICCPFCDNTFCPKISVCVLGEIGQSSNEASITPPVSWATTSSPCRAALSPSRCRRSLLQFTQNYVSPFVIRKELESILQREGEECLRVLTPKHSLLYRHESLTWNLIWYIHRLGLPTHLLECFPVWLMSRQSEYRAQHCGGSQKRTTDGHNFVPDIFLQVQLSPVVPVYVTVRWNAFLSPGCMANQPLHRRWNRLKSEFETQWMLVPGRPDSKAAQSYVHSNLIASSMCPIDITLAGVVDAIRASNFSYAVDTLLRFRQCILLGWPMSTIIRSTPTMVAHPTDLPDVPNPTGQSDSTTTATVAGCSQCTHSHQDAWILKESLYRELLFLTLVVMTPGLVNLVQFDEAYDTQLSKYMSNQFSVVCRFDRPPSPLAAACRQMLRPLTLSN